MYCYEVMKMELKLSAILGLGVISLFLLTITSASGAGSRHPCDRTCVVGAAPMTCVFNWTLELYTTMNFDCGRCPYVIEDCSNVGCVPANGVERIITTINQQMPGPPINVCKGDKVVVHVENHAGVAATTIHWHGMNQVGTPFMDGVPMVTQCPVHPFTSFEYTFRADDVGTYFYHSHMGFQRTDGVNGILVVRIPKELEPNKAYYDYDLTSHEIMLSDWINKTGEEMLNLFYQSRNNVDYADYLTTILVDGKGRLQPFLNETTGTTHYTPYASYVVKKGSRYRFRICSNANWICPMEVSVVNHDLTVIGTDGDAVKPVIVNALVINPGERFDFVINANQPINTYWILFRGLMRCEMMNTVGRGILKYETARDVEPPEPVFSTPKKVLNPVNDPFNSSSQISLVKLQSYSPPDDATNKKVADKKFYIPFSLYLNLNPLYLVRSTLLAAVNDTAFLAPPSPMLTQFNDIPKNRLCTENNPKDCTQEFCQCAYYLKVKLNQVVEIILIDVGPTSQGGVNHPWHLHGHHFRVLSESFMQTNNTVAFVKSLDEAGKIKRNLDRPVKKDTVSVPHGGYTVVRFHATNPGMWAFHCHVEMHTETGMMLVFQVGDIKDFPKAPAGFPKCGNFPK